MAERPPPISINTNLKTQKTIFYIAGRIQTRFYALKKVVDVKKLFWEEISISPKLKIEKNLF